MNAMKLLNDKQVNKVNYLFIPVMVSGLEWTKINSAYYPENSRMVFMINGKMLESHRVLKK